MAEAGRATSVLSSDRTGKHRYPSSRVSPGKTGLDSRAKQAYLLSLEVLVHEDRPALVEGEVGRSCGERDGRPKGGLERDAQADAEGRKSARVSCESMLTGKL